MLARVAAEIVLLLHFLFVVFAIVGGFFVLLDPYVMWIHIPVVLWSSIVNLASWTCPLTPLEQKCRRLAGQTGYEGGFVQHYIGPLVYPGGMPRRMERIAGVSIVVWNAIVYAVIFAVRR